MYQSLYFLQRLWSVFISLIVYTRLASQSHYFAHITSSSSLLPLWPFIPSVLSLTLLQIHLTTDLQNQPDCIRGFIFLDFTVSLSSFLYFHDSLNSVWGTVFRLTFRPFLSVSACTSRKFLNSQSYKGLWGISPNLQLGAFGDQNELIRFWGGGICIYGFPWSFDWLFFSIFVYSSVVFGWRPVSCWMHTNTLHCVMLFCVAYIKLIQTIFRMWLYSIWCVFEHHSDDRSADIFREKIESSTQMKAVLGADPRPNCLIIDEIDGAPQVSLCAKLKGTSTLKYIPRKTNICVK